MSLYRFLRPCWAVLPLAAGLSLAGFGWCQPPPPVAPNPLAPTLNMPSPLGMQPGTAVEMMLTGANLAEPTGLWTSFPAKATFPTDSNNGKDNAKLRVRLEVGKDVPLGFHTLRLATMRGLSNFRIFCIDDLPPVAEVFTNRAKTTPQPVPIPCVVSGRIDAEVSAYHKISVKAGQRVSFEVLGHRLGSALDPQISLIDPRSQRELAYDNDAPGLQTDSRLTHVFKEAGDYLIEVRDSKWAGGGDFWYRLRIGDFPCATTPIPLAAKRGSKVAVRFAGPTVDGVSPVEVTVPADPLVDTVWVTPRGANGLHGWPVALAVSDLDEVVESEPNNDPVKANRIPVPGAITGRFLEKGDVDQFVFTAKKGQRYLVQAHTHELNSPADVDMILKNAAGAQLGATNPQAPPPTDQRIDFTAPADGDYRLEVQHLTLWGGPDQTYRVSITPYEPGFDLSLGIDRYDVAPGAATALAVMAVRRDYAGPIEVSVLGPAGLSGQAIIPAGQPTAPNLPAAMLYLSAKADVPPGPYTIALQGKATINGKVVTSLLSVGTVVSQNMAGLPFPPRQLLHPVGISVTEKPPFTLTVKLDPSEGVRGLPLSATVTAARAAGFAEEIALTPVGLPPNVPPPAAKIEKGKNEVKIALAPAANAPLGQFSISFTGKTKFQNKDYSVTATPAPLVLALPFDLNVEPAPLKIVQGAKGKVKITAIRKGGYQGPIAVELRNLPTNVTADKGTIAMGQAAVEIEITVAAAAAPGDKGDVNVLGTASAAANQQNASPNFLLGVVKK